MESFFFLCHILYYLKMKQMKNISTLFTKYPENENYPILFRKFKSNKIIVTDRIFVKLVQN